MENNEQFMSLEKEISEISENIKNKSSKLEKLETVINPLINEINSKYLSITIEEVLQNLPSKAIGSKGYIEKLNKQSELYNDVQFNKIIRFLSFIEESEKMYRESYSELSKVYWTKPDKEDAEDLVMQHKLIHSEYKLMEVLCGCIKTDKVMFNKIYNSLEDRGVFLTKYEVMTMDYLSSISENIESVVGYLGEMNDSLATISSSLWGIESGIDNMSYKLDEIDGGIKAGNLLKSVQTYELYKINKNTKGK